MNKIVVLISVLLAGCSGSGISYSTSTKTIPKEDKIAKNERFKTEYVTLDYSTLQLITDTQTGVQYLTRSQGGFIKLESTPLESTTINITK